MKLHDLFEGAAYRLSDMLKTYPGLEEIFIMDRDSFGNKEYVATKTGDILKEHILHLIFYRCIEKYDENAYHGDIDNLAVKKEFIDEIYSLLESFSEAVKSYISDSHEFYRKHIELVRQIRIHDDFLRITNANEIETAQSFKQLYKQSSKILGDVGKLAYVPFKINFIEDDEKYTINKGTLIIDSHEGNHYGGVYNIPALVRLKDKTFESTCNLFVLVDKDIVNVTLTTQDEFKKHKAIFKITKN